MEIKEGGNEAFLLALGVLAVARSVGLVVLMTRVSAAWMVVAMVIVVMLDLSGRP
jgi:hypothetical protein